MSKYTFQFPCYLSKLVIKNGDGKRNIFNFTKYAKLICYRNPQRDIEIIAKGIGDWIADRGIDNLERIEYIRNEKKWKKYHKKIFVHFQDGTEMVKIKDHNTIRIRGRYKLWAFQKIQDEEVE